MLSLTLKSPTIIMTQYHPSNEVYNEVKNPLLRQISKTMAQTLQDMGEVYRISSRFGSKNELLRAFTINTDYALRFSVLNHRPDNVHMSIQHFVSVFENERSAGWVCERTIDFGAGKNGKLSMQALAEIADIANNTLSLSGKSARAPRIGFLCREGHDQALSKWEAGTFIINEVLVHSGKDYSIDFMDTERGLRATIGGTNAESFSNPHRSVGCRAVVHQSGCVRVMRESNFNKLYQISQAG